MRNLALWNPPGNVCAAPSVTAHQYKRAAQGGSVWPGRKAGAPELILQSQLGAEILFVYLAGCTSDVNG